MIYKYLLPFILLSSSFSSSAETRWFEIELLLFERNTNMADLKEDLAKDDIVVDTTKSIPLYSSGINTSCTTNSLSNQSSQSLCHAKKTPLLITQQQFASQTNGFTYIDNSALQFKAVRNKLAQHASFTPVLHLAWQMPVTSQHRAKAIHLFAGENFADKIINDRNLKNQIQNSKDQLFYEMEQKTIQKPVNITDKWAIDGNFKVYLDHYLFIDSQLLVRKLVKRDVIQPNTQEAGVEIIDDENNVQLLRHNDNLQPQTVKQELVINESLFDQNRRLRSGEIHYFDNPLMGMIVQIRKIKEKKTAE